MKKHKKIVGILALIGTMFLSTQAFGYWIEDEHGWKFLRPDGSYIEESLEWIDGNFDGRAEMYYFDQDGYCLQNGIKNGKNSMQTVPGSIEEWSSPGILEILPDGIV